MDEPRIVEELAALAHEQWAGWMRYLFLCSNEGPDGTFTIPRDKVDRWQRQIRTDYVYLSEKEKESDRKEARRVIALLLRQGLTVAELDTARVEPDEVRNAR